MEWMRFWKRSLSRSGCNHRFDRCNERILRDKGGFIYGQINRDLPQA